MRHGKTIKQRFQEFGYAAGAGDYDETVHSVLDDLEALGGFLVDVVEVAPTVEVDAGMTVLVEIDT